MSPVCVRRRSQTVIAAVYNYKITTKRRIIAIENRNDGVVHGGSNNKPGDVGASNNKPGDDGARRTTGRHTRPRYSRIPLE